MCYYYVKREEIINMSNENNNQFNQSQGNNQQYYQASQQSMHYNQQNTNIPPMSAVEEKASVGLAILSYLIPLVGLILYLTKKDTKPKTAKVCGKCALASFIINVVLSVVIYTAIGTSMLGEIMDDKSSDTNSSYSAQVNSDTQEDSQKTGSASSNGAIGDYNCVIKGAELTKNYDGKDAIIITYEFTNNSDSAQSFDTALNDELYQNGIGLEMAFFLDETQTDDFDVNIQPGVTKDVRKGYVLQDATAPIEVEISEIFSFSDDKIITTVEIPN